MRAERANLAWAVVFFAVLSVAGWGIASFPFPERERLVSVPLQTSIPTTGNTSSETSSPTPPISGSAIQEQKPLPLPPTNILPLAASPSDVRNQTAANTRNQWQVASSPLPVPSLKSQVQSSKLEGKKTENSESLPTPTPRSSLSPPQAVVLNQEPTTRMPSVKPISPEEIIALLRPPQTKPANPKTIPLPTATPLVSIPVKGKIQENENPLSLVPPIRSLEEAKTKKSKELLAEKPKPQDLPTAFPLPEPLAVPISAEVQGKSVTVPDGFTVYSLAQRVYQTPNAILGIDLLNESNPGVGDMNRRVAGAKLWVPPLDQRTLLRQQPDGSYHLILTSFRSMEDAEDYARFVIHARGYETAITPREVSDSHLLYRVAIVGLSSVEQAQQVWKLFNPDSSLARTQTGEKRVTTSSTGSPGSEVDNDDSRTSEEQLPEGVELSPMENQEETSPDL